MAFRLRQIDLQALDQRPIARMFAQRIHIHVLRHPVYLLQSELRHAVLQRVDRLLDGANLRQETRDIVVAGIVLRVDGDRTLGPLREDTQDRRCAIDS